MARVEEPFAAHLLEALLNRVDEGIHAVDENGNTVVYNEAMGRIEGLSPDSVLGRNVLEVFPSLLPETSTLMRALRTGHPVAETMQTYTNYKGRRITTVNLTIPLKREGRVVGAVEISKDITRLRQLSEKVIELQGAVSAGDGSREPGGRRSNLTRFTFDDLIGRDPAFLRAIDLVRKAARTSSPVLIWGETGTGKELVAQAIHNASDRAAGPFIGQNCAALPESLLEGILFGTCKGAFTGAVERPGLFEQAGSGTLLLDEVNSMPIELQAKILRVLQEGLVRRVGGTRDIAAEPRIIATMNLEPREALEAGLLRPDLYYRLSVVNISMPPLRERRRDIPLLVDHFVKRYAAAFGKPVSGVSEDALGMLMDYRWPGNARELMHVIEATFNVVGDERVISVEQLLPVMNASCISARSDEASPILNGVEDAWSRGLPEILDHVEREMIVRALKASGGTVSGAARRLGIKRQLLQYKMKKHGLKVGGCRPSGGGSENGSCETVSEGRDRSRWDKA